MIRFEMPVTREQYRAAWLAVPEEKRKRAVDHLRANLKPELLADVKERAEADPDNWFAGGHFGPGMFVRNVLRQVVADTDLPAVEYGWIEWGGKEPEPIHNWDDFYCQALEEAAGVVLPAEA